MEAIQFIQVTPDELTQKIAEALKAIFSPKEEDVLISLDEAAALIGVGQSTIQRWRKDGKITAYGAEGTVRYKKLEVLNVFKPLK